MIVGIDEVGRGPWAGPLVFGAVVLGDTEIEGLTDSKKLSKLRRERLSREIHEKALAVGLGWVSAEELDRLGMAGALTEGCQRALKEITVPYHQIVLDGTVNLLKDTGKGPYVTTMAKADLLVPSVSAASIVAKVARDRYMTEQDAIYPGYDFSSHAGYGTAGHRAAIDKLGVTPLHRLSFAPLSHYASVNADTGSGEHTLRPSRTVTAGQTGEDAAAIYLERNGFTVLERNWRIKAAEIDIIAEKEGTVYFVEVKYRRRSDQGGGMAAITPKKLRHMERAARLWMHHQGDVQARLSVIEVTGAEFMVTRFLEQV